MKIKICGIKYKSNLQEIMLLNPDYIGFIFYEKSKRYMKNSLLPFDLKNIKAKKVGVFVNSSIQEVSNAVNKYSLNVIQLHGIETPEMCSFFKHAGVEVIKAFSVDDDFDFRLTDKYKNCCHYFLFDAKGKEEGGNGIAFNWDLLKKYDQSIPYFLSGGIGEDNIREIAKNKNMDIYGIDINSKVEDAIGLKNIKKIKQVISILKTIKK